MPPACAGAVLVGREVRDMAAGQRGGDGADLGQHGAERDAVEARRAALPLLGLDRAITVGWEA